MDPSYSVLLDYDEENECIEEENKSKNNKVPAALIGGVVGGVLGLTLLCVLFVIFILPKIRLHMATRKARPQLDLDDLNHGSNDVNIEKMREMSVNTVAGTFVVQL